MDYQGTETILIVDDKRPTLRLFSKFFKGNGYTILTATDGNSAVSTYKEYSDQVDLVLMDVVMPHKDGIAALKELRELNSGLKVCLMSGHEDQDVSEPHHFIQKPCSPVEVIRIVRQILNS